MTKFLDNASSAFSAGQFNDVLAAFEHLVGEELDDPLANAWLGRAHFKLMHFSKARVILARAISDSATLPYWARDTLQHAAWEDLAPFEEHVPEVLRTDIEKIGASISGLLRGADASALLPSGRFTAATLVIYWIKTSVRTIFLQDHSTQNPAHELLELGLNKEFVEVAMKGANAVAKACAALSDDLLSLTSQDDFSPRLFDVIGAVKLRGKPILCPFTGARSIVRDSLDLYVYRYIFAGRVCVILNDDTTARAASDSAWFLPDRLVIVVATKWTHLHRTLARALLRAFDNREAFLRYVSNTEERPILVTDAYVGHLGHYIWNVISGWSRLFAHVQASKIDIITTHRPMQIFGGVKELYPDQTKHVGELIEIDAEGEAYRLMLERGALALTLVDRQVKRELAQRVVKWSRNHCSAIFLEGVAHIRSMRTPILLVTVRLENRAWIEQETGLPLIINRLAADFPRLGIVLDGLNDGISSLDTHAFMSLTQEKQLAAHIIDNCPNVPISNSIGCTAAESIVWCDTVDAFLAPIGAGMAKYRWITNKPGLAYSNETCLTPGNPDGHLYELYRSDLTSMEYVDRDAVKDVEKERHGMIFRANFSMNWEVPYRKIRDLLSRLNSN